MTPRSSATDPNLEKPSGKFSIGTGGYMIMRSIVSPYLLFSFEIYLFSCWTIYEILSKCFHFLSAKRVLFVSGTSNEFRDQNTCFSNSQSVVKRCNKSIGRASHSSLVPLERRYKKEIIGAILEPGKLTEVHLMG